MSDNHSNTVFSFGYESRKISDLIAEVKRLDAVVIDTRLKPYSRVDEWNKANLDRQLGESYRWIEEFGNLNYRHPEMEMEINNLGVGLDIVGLYHKAGIAMILLCYERNYNQCHRRIIAEAMAERFGMEIVHLMPEGTQLSLF